MTGGEGCCLGYHMHRAAYTICAILCPPPHLSARSAELYDYWCPNAEKDCYFNKTAILLFIQKCLETHGL